MIKIDIDRKAKVGVIDFEGQANEVFMEMAYVTAEILHNTARQTGTDEDYIFASYDELLRKVWRKKA